VTLINVLGVKPGEVFSSVFTLFKLVGLSGIIVAGILIGRAIPETPVNIGTIDTFPGIGAFALAMIGVLWSYGGWHHASYVAAETKGATRIVPRAMILGTLIVTATYMLANYAYLRLLPLETLASSQAVASDALKSVLPIGAMLVTLLIAISTFGSIGIYTLTAPRIYYSMARDGSFFRAIAKLHPRHQTPIWAISIQSGWAVVLLLFWTTFENLMTYVVFMDWVFMTLAALSIFYFRKKFAALPATGFRTPLYPIIPLVFIGISVWFVAYTLIGKPAQAWGGIVLLLAGLPVYYFSRKKEI